MLCIDSLLATSPTPMGCDALDVLSRQGTVMVTCQGSTSEEWAASVASMMRPVARQIRVFPIREDWRTIGVDLARPADRSEGIGESPLHMDFVNAEYPPDYVVLLCLREDPLGGGQSTLASIDQAVASISLEDSHLLQQPIFRDGLIHNLSNIGQDVNPFRVLTPLGHVQFRYTAQLLKCNYPQESADALSRLHAKLQALRVSFLLPVGHALIINQHRYVHGKLPLGARQEQIPISNRRLLLHGFFRSL